MTDVQNLDHHQVEVGMIAERVGRKGVKIGHLTDVGSGNRGVLPVYETTEFINNVGAGVGLYGNNFAIFFIRKSIKKTSIGQS